MTEDKFRSIYKQYYQIVKKVVYSVLRDVDLSEDICQEVFLQFLDKADCLDENFYKAWFIVTAKRKAVDFCRKAYQVHEVTSSSTNPEECIRESNTWVSSRVTVKSSSMEDEILKKIELREVLEKLFEELKNKNQEWYEIFKRSFLNEEKPEDIANALGISVSNLRARKHRLKKWIYRHHGDLFEDL